MQETIHLNKLDLNVCDIQNAYLTMDSQEKVRYPAGPEFVAEKGTIMLMKKELYGLKLSGAAFRAKLANKLHYMGYSASRADPDV